MLENRIVVFDFETGGLDLDTVEVIQVAALAMDPVSLRPIPGGEFESLLRPERPDLLQDRALQVNGKTREELAAAPAPGEVWHRFAEWTRQWNLKGRSDGKSCPIAAGYNILRFDLPIYRRYCFKYKTTRFAKRANCYEPAIFSGGVSHDVYQMLGMWTENDPQFKKLGMDWLRKFFRIPSTPGGRQTHDALRDVRDTAAILEKLLRLSRWFGPKVQWEGCFDAAFAAEQVRLRRERREAAAAKKESREQMRKGASAPWNP